MKTARRLPCALLVASLLASALPAAAAVLVVQPTDLVPVSNEYKYIMTPLAVTVHDNNVGGVAAVAYFTLPAGSVMTGGEYFHWSSTGQGSRCYVYRRRIKPTYNNVELLMSGSSYQVASDYVPVPIQLSGDADGTINARYLYYVYVGIDKGAGLGPVKIYYTPAP